MYYKYTIHINVTKYVKCDNVQNSLTLYEKWIVPNTVTVIQSAVLYISECQSVDINCGVGVVWSVETHDCLTIESCNTYLCQYSHIILQKPMAIPLLSTSFYLFYSMSHKTGPGDKMKKTQVPRVTSENILSV